MHYRQKVVKGVLQKSGYAFNKEVTLRIQMEKDKNSTVSIIAGGVIITVNRAELFKFLGGKIYE